MIYNENLLDVATSVDVAPEGACTCEYYWTKKICNIYVGLCWKIAPQKRPWQQTKGPHCGEISKAWVFVSFREWDP